MEKQSDITIAGGSEVIVPGWMPSPNGRGTLNIFWSCASTVVLCCWTTLCVNCPPIGSRKIGRFKRKCLVFLEALAGPEFIFQSALGQYHSARLSVQEFEAAGYQGWTIKHGFYADMGGFFLKPEHDDFPPFPLTASQIHYLVCKGYIEFDKVKIDLTEIDDKNKVDGVGRLIAAAQLFWFAINMFARIAQELSIATIEISTIAFVFCTLGTYTAWRHKPQDIAESKGLDVKVKLADLLLQAGSAAAKPYYYTPLDFVRRKPHHFEHVWTYGFRLGEILLGIRFHPARRPIDKVWDDRFGELTLRGNLLLMFVQFGFAAIHIAAWNFYFPTSIEAMLWHMSTVAVLSSMILSWMFISFAYELQPRLVSLWKPVTKEKEQGRIPSHRASLPLAAMPTIGFGVLYMLSRAYILVEDFVNLRELPLSAYDSVSWSDFVPHLS